MKKYFILLSFIFCFSNCFAEIFVIRLYTGMNDYNEGKIGMERRSISIHPSVTYDTDTGFLTVTSSCVINNVHIKITNSCGQMKLDEYVDLSPTNCGIFIDDMSCSDFYKIEIKYDNIYLYGYIE